MKMKQIAAMMLLLCLTAMGCLEQKEPAGAAQAAESKAAPPPAVDILTVETRPFTETADLPGRIAAVRSAKVCARVAGIVLAREFEEGSDVEKGQILFRIDPAPFQAALAGAEAQLARAQADLFDAAATFDRYRALIKTGAVSKQAFDSAQANMKKGKAAVQAAKAEIKTARLNLGYATVRAPISGRIGRAMVTEGALVGQGQATVMAEIRQLDPIYADFNQPVSAYLRLKTSLTENAAITKEGGQVTLTLEEVGSTRNGRLLFADARVDQRTGQVSLRAEFPNKDGLLLPGMFVRIRTPQAKMPEAVFVPQRAILRGTDGKARVMVINEKGEAQLREVATGAMVDGNWLITRGLVPGEKIVTTGADKVRPGMALAMADAEASAAKTAVN
ncbi:MAG: efflux RND transporter periplasmic adaptor subunit [Desulfobacter sp.]|nr:MAG: efflux RND transporter periplasmic adaptor subunit [Desulfobacter sp.]